MPRPHADRARKSVAAATIAAALASLASCSRTPPPASPRADRIALYEGLPHQGYEPEKLAEEKRTKPTVEKDGFPFYRDPLALKGEDAKALGAILGDAKTFAPFGGEKKCGGFHPDYAIAVTAGDEEIVYLICFGCGEVKVSGPDRPGTRYDLDHGATTRLKAILETYRKNRPGPIVGP